MCNERGSGERRRLTKVIAHDRRRLGRKDMVARLAINARPAPRIIPHHSLQTQEGVDLVATTAAVEASETHIAENTVTTA